LIDLTNFIREGDTILVGQGSAEPRSLVEALIAQRNALRGVTVFVGSSFTGLLKPEHADALRLIGLGGLGESVQLAKAGVLDVVPVHLGSMAQLITSGAIHVDVVLAQVSTPNVDGLHSFGLVADFLPAAISVARVTLAEVNPHVPFTGGHPLVRSDQIAATVFDDRPLITVPQRSATSTDAAIAKHVAALIPNNVTLQVGIGATPDGVLSRLVDRRGLGLHAGVLTDAILGLIECGAVDNAHKEVDRGVTVTGSLFGTERFYKWADHNAQLRVCPVSYTHDARVLATFESLYSVNGAIEVDLTGQINAETMGGVYAGTIGGGPVFARAAMMSPQGRSIITLPSSTRGGAVTRIVPRIPDGAVTTPRSDADVVVTEHGVAHLRGASISERMKRLIAIADPRHRDDLERFAFAERKS
jgi:acyl-CoA hydrolase